MPHRLFNDLAAVLMYLATGLIQTMDQTKSRLISSCSLDTRSSSNQLIIFDEILDLRDALNFFLFAAKKKASIINYFKVVV